jgi:hypothetical protein
MQKIVCYNNSAIKDVALAEQLGPRPFAIAEELFNKGGVK